MENVMVSTAEAEVGSFFYNGQEADPTHTNLH